VYVCVCVSSVKPVHHTEAVGRNELPLAGTVVWSRVNCGPINLWEGAISGVGIPGSQQCHLCRVTLRGEGKLVVFVIILFFYIFICIYRQRVCCNL